MRKFTKFCEAGFPVFN